MIGSIWASLTMAWCYFFHDVEAYDDNTAECNTCGRTWELEEEE
jgi:hypothetical protein